MSPQLSRLLAMANCYDTADPLPLVIRTGKGNRLNVAYTIQQLKGFTTKDVVVFDGIMVNAAKLRDVLRMVDADTLSWQSTKDYIDFTYARTTTRIMHWAWARNKNGHPTWNRIVYIGNQYN